MIPKTERYERKDENITQFFHSTSPTIIISQKAKETLTSITKKRLATANLSLHHLIVDPEKFQKLHLTLYLPILQIQMFHLAKEFFSKL